jgi:hypothetical protein
MTPTDEQVEHALRAALAELEFIDLRRGGEGDASEFPGCDFRQVVAALVRGFASPRDHGATGRRGLR